MIDYGPPPRTITWLGNNFLDVEKTFKRVGPVSNLTCEETQVSLKRNGDTLELRIPNVTGVFTLKEGAIVRPHFHYHEKHYVADAFSNKNDREPNGPCNCLEHKCNWEDR